jgi:hypothetical protein
LAAYFASASTSGKRAAARKDRQTLSEVFAAKTLHR